MIILQGGVINTVITPPALGWFRREKKMTTIIKTRCSECYGWIEFVHEEVGWIHLSADDEETCGVEQ